MNARSNLPLSIAVPPTTQPSTRNRKDAHPSWCDRSLCDVVDPDTPDEYTEHRARVLGERYDTPTGYVEAIVDTSAKRTEGVVLFMHGDDHALTTAQAVRIAEALERAAELVDQVPHAEGGVGVETDTRKPVVDLLQGVGEEEIEYSAVFVGCSGDAPLSPPVALALARRLRTAARIAEKMGGARFAPEARG